MIISINPRVSRKNRDSFGVMMQAEQPALFSVRTPSPEMWKRVVSSISTLLEEATFSISAQDGITFKGMDPSHVALLDVSLSPKDFERFDCSKEDRFTLRLDDFKKIIARAGAKDSVQISRQAGDVLEVKLGELRAFELHLLEARASGTPLPKLSFDTTFALDNSLFEGAIEDVGTVSNHVTIQSARDSMVFSGKGDAGSGRTTLAKDELCETGAEGGGKRKQVNIQLGIPAQDRKGFWSRRRHNRTRLLDKDAFEDHIQIG